MKRVKRIITGEVIRFGMTGVAAVAVHYGVYLLLARWTGLTAAYIMGYGVSFVCNFFLSCFFTFRVAPGWRGMARFMLSHLVNFFVQLLLFRVFLHLGVPDRLIPFCVLAIAVPLNFLLVRRALSARRPSA